MSPLLQAQGSSYITSKQKHKAPKLTSNAHLQGYSNQISHARELLLCYTSKKVTSQLHKLTTYKSNYTSIMYTKVITSLCKGDANQQEEQCLHGDFSLEVHMLANTLRPHCVDHSFGGLVANWHHLPSPHVGHHKNLPRK